MLVAIQKDPTIDAVFSIGSCCGPGMVAVREQLGDRVCLWYAFRHDRLIGRNTLTKAFNAQASPAPVAGFLASRYGIGMLN
jgi:hypothetical protein